MQRLIAAFQGHELTIPEGWMPVELETFEFSYTATGVKYEAPKGYHDDGVMALGLALYGWDRVQMVAFTLQPYVSAVEARLSMDDISTAGHYVKFALDDTFLRTEPMERLMVLEKMLSLGLITTEQAMQMEDLSPNGNGS